MSVRDDVESALRSWNKYELGRSAPAVIDYDCFPTGADITPATSRLTVYEQLDFLGVRSAEAGDTQLTARIGAHLAYLRSLMGERAPLDDYVRATQGCRARAWPEEYVTACGERAREHLTAMGITWGANTSTDLDEVEGRLDADSAADAIRQAATDFEPTVRLVASTEAPYSLTVETANVDAYWAYWLDGSGQQVRLRLNLRNATFTKVRARQFALHEVLGHGLQSASFAARCAQEDVPWVRLMSVHAQQQVMLEGLAQALPLFVTPNDEALIARVRLGHYLQLVLGELHLALDSGVSIAQCAEHARSRVPFWSDETIADALSDRGADPLLRSYLWSYVAGIDWFVCLADSKSSAIHDVLSAAYRQPLTPDDLAMLWSAGPPIGGGRE